MKMTAGQLTRRVTFDRPTVLDDGHHGEVQGWTTGVLTLWAHFSYLRGGEDVVAGRLAGRQPVVVTVGNSIDARQVDTTWRLRDEAGAVFNIREAPKPTQDRQWLELLVEAGVGT